MNQTKHKIFHSITFNENLTSRANRTQFVCLYGIYCLHFLTKKFHSYIDINFTVKGGKIKGFARHLWPMSREGFLSCHTCFDTGPRYLWGFVRKTVPLPWLVQQARATEDSL